MNKIKRSIKLLKSTFTVLFREKKLFFFPVIATALAMAVALFFIIPVTFYPTGHPYLSSEHWHDLASKLAQSFGPHHQQSSQSMLVGKYDSYFFSGNWWMTLLFTFLYFVSMFLATFSNVAFYHEIMQAMNGNAVSIRRGFYFAKSRWRGILLWSLFAGLVGYVINAIQERIGFLGRIITGFIGMAWSLACIFIIPTLVRNNETINPIKLLRYSAGTLKRTWGELIVGFIGLEAAFVTVFTIALIPVVVLFVIGDSHASEFLGIQAGWLIGLGVVILVVVASLFSWMSSLVNPIYRCALYIYATEGVVPGTFDKELLDSAWQVKNL